MIRVTVRIWRRIWRGILDGNQSWSGGVYGVLRVLGTAWLFWAEILVLCSGSCWSETGSSPWSGVSGTCRRSGKCGMGCNYAFLYHGMRGDRSNHLLKYGVHKLLWLLEEECEMCLLKLLIISVTVGIVAGLWPAQTFPISGAIIWSVVYPSGCGYIDVFEWDLPWWHGIPDGGIL